jgi:hypothetical protein
MILHYLYAVLLAFGLLARGSTSASSVWPAAGDPAHDATLAHSRFLGYTSLSDNQRSIFLAEQSAWDAAHPIQPQTSQHRSSRLPVRPLSGSYFMSFHAIVDAAHTEQRGFQNLPRESVADVEMSAMDQDQDRGWFLLPHKALYISTVS